MSENQPFNNSSFNPASNSAFDKSQPIQGQVAPAPAAVALVFLGVAGDPQVLSQPDRFGDTIPSLKPWWMGCGYHSFGHDYWCSDADCMGYLDDYRYFLNPRPRESDERYVAGSTGRPAVIPISARACCSRTINPASVCGCGGLLYPLACCFCVPWLLLGGKSVYS